MYMKTIFWAIIICKMHFILGCVNDSMSIAEMINDDFRDFQKNGRKVGGRDGRKLVSFITKNDNIEVIASTRNWWNEISVEGDGIYEITIVHFFDAKSALPSHTIFGYFDVFEVCDDGVITNYVVFIIDPSLYFAAESLKEKEISCFHCNCYVLCWRWNDRVWIANCSVKRIAVEKLLSLGV